MFMSLRCTQLITVCLWNIEKISDSKHHQTYKKKEQPEPGAYNDTVEEQAEGIGMGIQPIIKVMPVRGS